MDHFEFSLVLVSTIVLAASTSLLGLGLLWIRRSHSKSEGKATAILDAAVDGVITFDAKGRIETFNRAAEAIFGYSLSEVVGRNIKTLMLESSQSDYDEYLAAYKTTPNPRIIGTSREITALRKDGSTFPMDLAVGDSRQGGRHLFAGIVRDISDRRNAEDELRQSEERFRLIIENVRDYAIAWLDLDGRIVSWNEGGGRIYGWSIDEIGGKFTDVLYPPELKDEAAQSLRKVREYGRFEGEGWRSRKDGSRFWAHAVITPLWDGKGNMRGFVRVSHDITARKQVEENMQVAKDTAERLKDEAERAKEEADRAREEADRAREEADRARDEANRANFAKSTFLAAASHDLRQPVQAMVFFAEALGTSVADSAPHELVDNLKGSLGALCTLLESLLDVSRLDAGVVIPEESTFSLSELLWRLVSDLSPLAAQKGIALTSVSTSAIVHTDATLLGRILQNLLSNAVKYTNCGRILIGCRRLGTRIRIEVWDTGIGIPKDRITDVFQEFYQVGNSERDRTQGLGLGLSIVQRLTRLLKVNLSVQSVEGRGSVFSVDMPVIGYNTKQNLAYLRHSPKNEPRQDKPIVFIIDDEAAVLLSLRVVIESWGYEVLTATMEDEAVNLLSAQSRPPDIIIADYRLKDGRTGAQAINRIWDLFGRKISSIIITGDTAPERIREAEAHGLTLIHKPMQPSLLKAMIAKSVAE
ncbi:MAG TPA: PAS domain S-box protein [Rhodospirillaceae bacterium]|nr:PAS domain S-box protein [Rhodospirillaceae bacterium]